MSAVEPLFIIYENSSPAIQLCEPRRLRRQGGEEPRGVTGIFFWGGNVIFPEFFPGVKCFLPVENSRFGRPKTNFRLFQKSFFSKKKKKKEEKKKKGPHLFL